MTDYDFGVAVGMELGKRLWPQHVLVIDWKQAAAEMMVEGVRKGGEAGREMMAAARAVTSCAFQLEAALKTARAGTDDRST